MKKILIVSYHFHPEILPRAFRAFELAQALGKDNQVDVLTPTEANFDRPNYRHIQIPPGLKASIRLTGNSAPTNSTMKESWKKNLLRKVLHFLLPGGMSTLFAFSVVKNRHLLKANYDGIISIGLPLGSHLGSFLLKVLFKKSDKLIFDYGDPFLRNPKTHWSPFNYILEKTILSAADGVIVPVANAIPAFDGLISKNKVHVIPQGLNIEDISVKGYTQTDIPKIGYAGMFYNGIRDPETFMKKALSLDSKFRLIFLSDLQGENLKLIQKYQKYDVYGKLELVQSIPRAECISFLSTCDFVINFKNRSAIQNPSKLIDYALAKRPVLDIDPSSDDVTEFKSFLDQDYSAAQKPIKLADYDIKNIAKTVSDLI